MQTAWPYPIGKYRTRCLQAAWPYLIGKYRTRCLQAAWPYPIGKYRSRRLQAAWPYPIGKHRTRLPGRRPHDIEHGEAHEIKMCAQHGFPSKPLA